MPQHCITSEHLSLNDLVPIVIKYVFNIIGGEED